MFCVADSFQPLLSYDDTEFLGCGDALLCLSVIVAHTSSVRHIKFNVSQHTPVVSSLARRNETKFRALSVDYLMGGRSLALPCILEGGRTGASSFPTVSSRFLRRT
jgi:hypothetical protein